jgi:acetyl esterase
MKQTPLTSRLRARLMRLMFDIVVPLMWLGRRPSVASVRRTAIAGPGGPLRLRIYTPPGTGPFPVMLYVHGGGWVIGSLAAYDGVARNLCRDNGCVVVAVDYRLAPEHRFPAASDDCLAALAWVHANCAALDGDTTRVVLAGDSAGGNLATVTAARARDDAALPVAGQLLIYPVTGYHTPPTPSYAEPDKGRMLSAAQMAWFFEQYLESPAAAGDPCACPLARADLAGLPPALVITAGHDPLRDEGRQYAQALAAAGVAVTASHHAEQQHGFVGLSGPTRAHLRAMAEIRDWLARVLA